MKKLLTLKHWQLFMLLAALGLWSKDIGFLNTLSFLALITFILWVFAIGYYGQELIKRLGLKDMNVSLFKANIAFIISVVILNKLYPFLSSSVSDVLNYALPILTILGFLAGAHVFLFASKTLTKAEYQREVVFDDYFTNFLYMAGFIIGIWFIQPKINRLFEEPQPAL